MNSVVCDETRNVGTSIYVYIYMYISQTESFENIHNGSLLCRMHTVRSTVAERERLYWVITKGVLEYRQLCIC